MQKKIRFVVATRKTRHDFFTTTATGKSFLLYGNNSSFMELSLFDENDKGLPHVYNQAIAAAKTDPAILVFIHDDIHIVDFYWAGKLLQALNTFQLVGLVGNKQRRPNQPAWLFLDLDKTLDNPANYSGVVGTGNGFPPQSVAYYGEPWQEVKLLDGLFLAIDSTTIDAHGLSFDERFDFHFYDFDFCRQAEQKGVRMGTCDICVVHESDGNYFSDPWLAAYQTYLQKWGS